MNFRYGGSGYAYIKSGVNIPAIYSEMIQGRPLNSSTFVNKKAIYVNERMCLDDWYKGAISTREFRSIRKDCDISFIADDDDCMPGKQFRELVLKVAVKRALKKCIGR